MANNGIVKVGSQDKFEVLGVDWKEKKLGVPLWGWAGGVAFLIYKYAFKKGRR